MPLYLLTIPGLRTSDVARLPLTMTHLKGGSQATIVAGTPSVTCPVQANMTTGVLPSTHGVVANGFFWREKGHKQEGQVEMWTAWNDCIQAPQIWDKLHEKNPHIKSAVWFPMHHKGCGADLICTPAPIHNPDGSESLWCYTKPEMMYGDLRDTFGHFPLMNFWGPMTNVKSVAWIADSAAWMAKQERPDFAYIYLPHLDYAAQRTGPDSPAAMTALDELDVVLNKFMGEVNAAYGEPVDWLLTSEYVIQPVDHVSYPNRVLREMGLIAFTDEVACEQLDVVNSPAWALVDHQISHVFVSEADSATIAKIVDRFKREPGIDRVLTRDELSPIGLDHSRSGDVVLLSTPNSWQAYYWWTDDTKAPPYARTVDIHKKPGYDPVELFIDMPAKSIPLDATLMKGSHGVAVAGSERAVLLSSAQIKLSAESFADTDVAELVLGRFA